MSFATALTPLELDGDTLFEVVDGQLVESPPMGANGVRIAFKLGARVEAFAESQSVGRAVTEALFRLQSSPPINRRPDMAFVSFDRWPERRRTPTTASWNVIPDLAVEVVSPTNLAEEIPTRVREYFEAGVRLVWVIYPHESLVYAYDDPWTIRVLGRDDRLVGGMVLPGFELPLADLFEGPEMDDGPAS